MTKMVKSSWLAIVENIDILEECIQYDPNLKKVTVSDDGVTISYLINTGEEVQEAIITSVNNDIVHFTLIGCDNVNTVEVDLNSWDNNDNNMLLLSDIIAKLSNLIDDATYVSRVFTDFNKHFK